ncbi:hypothetical protein EV363DRAFT_1168167 [Boletus edulis]|nr:hypothetical protein EV363DRAFT_1168167 [Boletus edulis]
MDFLIENKVASVEDVAHLSLSPAGRVAELQSRCNPADSVSLPFISSPHLSSAKPARPSSLTRNEEWTDELEARMQNGIDRMLDARRQLAEPVLNFS